MKAFVALLVVLALGFGGWKLYPLLQTPPAAVQPAQREGLDPDVTQLVDGLIERVEAAPRKAQLHADLGLAYEANEMWAEAVQSFRNALQLDSGKPLYRLHLAVALRQAGDREAALEELRAAARQLKEAGPPLAAAGAHHRLGVFLLEDGDVDGAEEAFRETLRIGVRLPGAEKNAAEMAGYLGLGEVFNEREDYNEAIQMLELVLRTDSTIRSAHYALGLAYRNVGREQEALRELQLGKDAKRLYLPDVHAADLRRYKVNYSGRINMAADYLDAGRPALAAQLLETMLRRYPEDVNVLSSLAAARIGVGDFAGAEELLRKADGKADDEFAIPLYLSEALQGLERLPEALEAADRAVSVAPDQSSTHFRRGRVLASMGDYPRAYSALKRTVELDPDNADALIGLGELCVRMEELGKAEEHYLAAVEKAPFALPAHVSLAAIYLRQGKTDPARRALEAAEAISAEHPRVVELRRRVEAAR